MNSVWNLFIAPPKSDENDEVKAVESPASKTPPKKAAAPVVVGSLAGSSSAPATVLPTVDPEMMAKLEQAMLSDGNNAVFRFRAVFDSLADIIPEADKRLQAAIKAATSQGLKAEDVLADILSDERILADKETEFSQLVAQQRENALGGKQKQMEAAATEIEKKRAEILALQNSISQLEASQTALQEQAATEARKIADIEARFSATLNAVRGERAMLKEKLQPYCAKKGS